LTILPGCPIHRATQNPDGPHQDRLAGRTSPGQADHCQSRGGPRGTLPAAVPRFSRQPLDPPSGSVAASLPLRAIPGRLAPISPERIGAFSHCNNDLRQT
jgi:hypothetical protein